MTHDWRDPADPLYGFRHAYDVPTPPVWADGIDRSSWLVDVRIRVYDGGWVLRVPTEAEDPDPEGFYVPYDAIDVRPAMAPQSSSGIWPVPTETMVADGRQPYSLALSNNRWAFDLFEHGRDDQKHRWSRASHGRGPAEGRTEVVTVDGYDAVWAAAREGSTAPSMVSLAPNSSDPGSLGLNADPGTSVSHARVAGYQYARDSAITNYPTIFDSYPVQEMNVYQGLAAVNPHLHAPYVNGDYEQGLAPVGALVGDRDLGRNLLLDSTDLFPYLDDDDPRESTLVIDPAGRQTYVEWEGGAAQHVIDSVELVAATAAWSGLWALWAPTAAHRLPGQYGNSPTVDFRQVPPGSSAYRMVDGLTGVSGTQKWIDSLRWVPPGEAGGFPVLASSERAAGDHGPWSWPKVEGDEPLTIWWRDDVSPVPWVNSPPPLGSVGEVPLLVQHRDVQTGVAASYAGRVGVWEPGGMYVTRNRVTVDRLRLRFHLTLPRRRVWHPVGVPPLRLMQRDDGSWPTGAAETPRTFGGGQPTSAEHQSRNVPGGQWPSSRVLGQGNTYF